MLVGYLTLLSGLLISAIAIYYSVEGLVAIYPAMVVPIVIMGVVIELGKLSLTVWLKQYWERAPIFLKTYMLPAVAVLMLITSIGVFGFLSKAHSDQNLVSGDVQSKIAIYDEKIKTAKENIESNRKQLKQMDDAVDQVMARSQDEKGADKANAIRKSQSRDRVALTKDIEANQKLVIQLNDQAAPIRAEVRKVEAEVGPIKYIAAFIYGDNPDENVLEKAVRWVIILIVIVFDPLAVILLLASQYSFEIERKKKDQPEEEEFFDKAREVAQSIDDGTYVSPIVPPMGPITSYTYTTYEPDEGALTDEQVEIIRQMVKDELPKGEIITKSSLFPDTDEEFPFRGKGIQPGMPLTASYVQPSINKVEEFTEDDYDNINVPVAPEEPKPVITDIGGGYVSVDGKVYHHKAWDHHSESASHVVEKHNEPTYVQNEEQSESGTWTKIVSKPISEEEYLEAAKQKSKKDD